MNRISTGPLGPIVRYVGLNYEHDAAEDAWARISDFFEQYLR
jgi:dienelactone hydrolase